MAVAMHEVLRPALDAARRALRDLEPDQIPADLRKVVAYSGGKLPPPLARALLGAVAKYEWLRHKALESWPEADVDAGGTEGAAALYLSRPDGWELELAELAAAEGAAAAAVEGTAAGREVAELRKKESALSRKLKESERSHRSQVAALEARLDEARSERRADLAAASREDRVLQEELDEQRRTLDEVRRERDGLEAELREVRNALAAERRARREAESAASGAAETGSWQAADPLAVAARLDEVATMARPSVSESAAAAPGGGGLEFPSAVGPDSAEAIRWLLGREEAITLLVDGYNVGFRLTGRRKPGPARERLLPVLERLRRLAVGSLRVVAVFDSSEESVEVVPPQGPVKVVFTAPGRSADDEIAELTARLDGPVVVVTSDRTVRERAEAGGGLALWSESLVGWAARR